MTAVDKQRSKDGRRTQTTRTSTANTTASLGPALSASVIATLGDADGYEADESSIGISRDGDIVPANSKKKQFPRGMKRLRDRLQILDDRLRLDVNALKQQISDLQLHRSLLSTKLQVQQPQTTPSAVDGRERAAETVAEYFRAFEFGWILPVDSNDEDGVARLNRSFLSRQTRRLGQRIFVDDEEKLTAREQQELRVFQRECQGRLAERQGHFSRTAIEQLMQVGDRYNGVGMFVQQWITFSRLHDITRLTFTRMKCHGSPLEPIVIAHGTRSGFVTHLQLQELYPSALTDPMLVKHLVGVFIEYPSREIFHFDSFGQLVRYEADVDIVKALQETVGDVFVVESMFAWELEARTV